MSKTCNKGLTFYTSSLLYSVDGLVYALMIGHPTILHGCPYALVLDTTGIVASAEIWWKCDGNLFTSSHVKYYGKPGAGKIAIFVDPNIFVDPHQSRPKIRRNSRRSSLVTWQHLSIEINFEQLCKRTHNKGICLQLQSDNSVLLLGRQSNLRNLYCQCPLGFLFHKMDTGSSNFKQQPR